MQQVIAKYFFLFLSRKIKHFRSFNTVQSFNRLAVYMWQEFFFFCLVETKFFVIVQNGFHRVNLNFCHEAND